MTSTLKSTLHDLVSRTTVNFPRSIRASELRDMFGIIAKNRKYVFNFITTIREIIGKRVETVELPNERYTLEIYQLPNEIYIDSLKGIIKDQKFNSAQFRCTINTNYDHPQGPRERFVGIKFETTPGYSLDELEGRVTDNLDIMDGVREEIEKYFKSTSI